MVFFAPHSAYAEDQKYAKSILTYHVLRSGATMGAILAIPFAIRSTLFQGPKTLPAFSSNLFIHSFRGTLGGLLFGALALGGRMWDKQDIEWQDRTWRLLENRGQIEVDRWIFEGEVIGGSGTLLAARMGRLPSALIGKTFTAVIGGIGIGAAASTTGYVLWRHAIWRGKFPERRYTISKEDTTL
ncbi:hypothetical protein EJ08DRAFT_385959 [Tothia fuscella]|uniref:Uncharacterized protein n=1 Tax=Tothia fuscella TaxID=1048955 RepID=A0A9P4P0E1_9PEZI|nr:hypothetical protein EJ08DRAFT_385959 [Tothia fuscella]